MFSKPCQYALRSTFYLAIYSDETRKLSVQQIAEQLQIPRQFLGKILNKLGRAGLISSAKGPGGGFFLSEQNRMSTLYDYVKCIDGEGVLENCILGLPECSNLNPCPLHFQVSGFNQGLLYQLQNTTIEKLGKIFGKEQLNL